MPCKYIIHTVGPKWKGGNKGEEALLRSCYMESLALAKNYGCKTIAFPLISAGIYGYPKEQAFIIAVSAISEFLKFDDMTVFLAVFDDETFSIGARLFAEN